MAAGYRHIRALVPVPEDASAHTCLVCMYVSMYMHLYISTCSCTHMQVYVQMDTCVYIEMDIPIHICTYV